MKRIYILIVTLALIFGCTSCGQKSDFTEKGRAYVADASSYFDSYVAPPCLDTCLGFATQCLWAVSKTLTMWNGLLLVMILL